MHFRSLNTRGHPLTTWILALHYCCTSPQTTVSIIHCTDDTHTADCTDYTHTHTHTRTHTHTNRADCTDYTLYFTKYCIAYITLLVIVTLPSPLICHSLALLCLFSHVLLLARVSWINPLPSHSDSVCISLGLLLMYLDYLYALPCWILFADRRPSLALGLLFVLSVLYLFALHESCLFCDLVPQ